MKTPKLILSELKSVNEPPKEDGYYIVFGIDKGLVYYVAHIHYTTAYGWNTYDHHSKSPIIYEDDNTYFWCTAKAIKGEQK